MTEIFLAVIASGAACVTMLLVTDRLVHRWGRPRVSKSVLEVSTAVVVDLQQMRKAKHEQN